MALEQIRCPRCNRRLVDLKGRAQIACPKCKSVVEVDTETKKINIISERRK